MTPAMRCAAVCVLGSVLSARVSFAQEVESGGPRSAPVPAAKGTGGICEIDPTACPKIGDVERLAKRQRWLAPPPPDEELEPKEATIRAKPPPRSASDWEVDEETLRAAPKQNGADAIQEM